MKQHKLTPYALLLITAGMSVTSYALAEEQLSEIKVTDEMSSTTHTQTQPAVIHKNVRAIREEMIRDTRDLVRYTTDVGISDNGRHLKGFAMRGVEGNRVGTSVDGVSIPDFEENSLYARYGNFNSSRLTIDPELVRGIDVVRGSSSFNSGSGYLGGGVNYHTLEAIDLVKPENKFGGLLKSGYSSKNREWIYTSGLGYKDGKWEAALLYSQRRGHEMKSNGKGGLDTYGSSRGIPDPSQHTNHSYLAKISYLLNDTHKFSASLNGQINKNNTDEKSYNLQEGYWRETRDLGKRQMVNLAYEYFPQGGGISYFRTDYDWQKTDVGAINYKGAYPTDYTTFLPDFNKKELRQIYDRLMQTDFNRISFRLDSKEFDGDIGIHKFSLKVGTSRHNFRNINIDRHDVTTTEIDRNTIQRPIRTNHTYISLLDSITWNNTFSSDVGIRYDRYKLKPQALNARCISCTTDIDEARFNGLSGFVGLNTNLTEIWKLGYTLSSGFRVPSASEIYFTFDSGAGSWLANPDLKAEKSLTHNLYLRGEGDIGQLGINLYHTKYKNFLFDETVLKEVGTRETYYTQSVNKDKARISGIEINGRLNLHQLASFVPNGFKLMGGLGYSKGKVSGSTSLLSIQPLKAILGLDYEDPNGKWGIFSRITYLAGKKGKDAKTLNDVGRYCKKESPNPDYDPDYPISYDNQPSNCDRYGTLLGTVDFPYLNKAATIFDLYGYLNVTKDITLRAGVYNVFNRRYHTWDSLRGIPLVGATTNTVDSQGKGLQRFYAPGRNFAASVEIRF